MFYESRRHKQLQGSYNVFLCVQASTVCFSGKLQADEKCISPNHVSNATIYLTYTQKQQLKY